MGLIGMEFSITDGAEVLAKEGNVAVFLFFLVSRDDAGLPDMVTAGMPIQYRGACGSRTCWCKVSVGS